MNPHEVARTGCVPSIGRTGIRLHGGIFVAVEGLVELSRSARRLADDDVRAGHAMAEIVGRAETGERAEIVIEMRLIEVPA
jgi:hypothetical protein